MFLTQRKTKPLLPPNHNAKAVSTTWSCTFAISITTTNKSRNFFILNVLWFFVAFNKRDLTGYCRKKFDGEGNFLGIFLEKRNLQFQSINYSHPIRLRISTHTSSNLSCSLTHSGRSQFIQPITFNISSWISSTLSKFQQIDSLWNTLFRECRNIFKGVETFSKIACYLPFYLYFCIAVPGGPLPDIQMLVMNPGFLLPFCVCKNSNYPFSITWNCWFSLLIIIKSRTIRETRIVQKWIDVTKCDFNTSKVTIVTLENNWKSNCDLCSKYSLKMIIFELSEKIATFAAWKHQKLNSDAKVHESYSSHNANYGSIPRRWLHKTQRR